MSDQRPTTTTDTGMLISLRRRVPVMALPPRTPWPSRIVSPRVGVVSWCSQAAMLAASSACR